LVCFSYRSPLEGKHLRKKFTLEVEGRLSFPDDLDLASSALCHGAQMD